MLEKLRQSFLQWREAVDKLEDELETKKQRLAFLEESPLPPDELAESVVQTMLTHAEREFYQHLDVKLNPAITDPLRDPGEGNWKPPLISKLNQPNSTSVWSLFWLLREPLSTAIRNEIMAWDGLPAAGPPRAEREKEIPKLERDITRLQETIERERREAREAGVELGQIHNRPSLKEQSGRGQG